MKGDFAGEELACFKLLDFLDRRRKLREEHTPLLQVYASVCKKPQLKNENFIMTHQKRIKKENPKKSNLIVNDTWKY